MSFQDRTIVCADCSTGFTFTSREQAFYAERGFSNDPKRCPSCRAARKTERSASRGYGGAREMTRVVCDSCGKETEVPFVPRGDRPVYCSDCYSTRRSQSYAGSGRL